MILLDIIAAILFILSSGVLFNQKFRDNAFLVIMAGVIAIVSTYFLGEQILERAQQAREATNRFIALIPNPSWPRGGDGGKEKQNGTQPPAKRSEEPATKNRDEAQTKPSGDFIQDCEDCPRLVQIPAGHYRIGSPKDEPGHERAEEPLTDITIAKPFAIGQFKVTFAQWDACAASGGCKYRPEDSSWGRGDRPVINVSWDDAHDYISWLRTRTKKSYRLPTEAEWEYAARAGSQGAYFWGDNISPSQANYNNRKGTVPVSMFEKNKFGLYQVHGNLGEWVEDCWRDNYAKIPRDGTGYRSDDCEKHVVRGGYWAFGPEQIRSASRGSGDHAIRSPLFGFRIARDL